MIEVENLTHRYGESLALRNVSFEVKEGEIFGLLGPNGGGKSTLFRILSTMMVPTEGRARWPGPTWCANPPRCAARWAWCSKRQSLDKALTVEENLRAQGHLHGLSGAVLRERMERAMERLGLPDRRKDLVETLSGGLRRRVEIAKALLHRPHVLLMDEASTGLDPAARLDLSRHVEQLRDKDGVTILLTTHILEEAGRCDRLVLLHEGAWWPKAARRPAGAHRRRRGGARSRRSAALAAGIQQRFGLRPSRMEARCAWRSPTAIASSPKWWKPSLAPSNRWGCTSPPSKTSS